MGFLKKISVKIQSQFSPPQSSSSSSSSSPQSRGRKVTLPVNSPSTSSDLIISNSNSNRGDNLITAANSFGSTCPPSSAHASPSSALPAIVARAAVKFQPGDKVKVIKNVDQLRVMQEGHGGWNVKMTRLPFTTGTVHRITVSGNVRVRFGTDELAPKFTINPDALAFHKDNYCIGDTVLVDDDMKRVELLQKDHGEWIDQMECIIGKSGNVIALDEDNDLQVLFDCERIYTLNPLTVSLVSPSYSSSPLSSSLTDEEETSVASIYPKLKGSSSQVEVKPSVYSANWLHSELNHSRHCSSVTERLKLLEDKFSEIEEVYSCNICMERVRKVVFMCGHGTCIKCSHSLTSCHMCRLPITRKIHLY